MEVRRQFTMTGPQQLKHLTSLSGFAAGLLSGLGVLGLVQAFYLKGHGPFGLLQERLFLVLTGNLAIGLGLAAGYGGLVLLRSRSGAQRTVRVLSPAAGFWIGAAFGVGPLLVTVLDSGSLAVAQPMVHYGVGIAGIVLLVIASPALAARVSPPRFALIGCASVVVIAVAAAWLGPGPRVGDAPPLALASRGELAAGSARPPDVVLISVDTLRADAILDPDVPLPNLDALRRRGAWSDFALATAPSTLPSHASILSGLNVLQHGARSNFDRLPVDRPLLPEAFLVAGYRTAGVVGNGVIRSSSGFSRGFETFCDEPMGRAIDLAKLWKTAKRQTWLGVLPGKNRVLGHLRQGEGGVSLAQASGEQTTEVALEYLKGLQQGAAPFFLFLNFMEPHAPYSPHESVRGGLVQEDALPVSYGQGYGTTFEIKEVMEALVAGDPLAREAAEFYRNVYLEEVTYVDYCIGRLVAQIDSGGRETVILFTSDHGEQFGENQKMGHGNSLFASVLRVPFILVAPGVEPDSRFAVVPQLQDIAPTLLALAGIERWGGLEGRNLVEDDRKRPQIAVAEEGLMVCDERWKLLASFSAAGTPDAQLQPLQLFDLLEDPTESVNCLERYPEHAARLSAIALPYLIAGAVPQLQDLTPQGRAMLSELGYAGSDDDS